MPIEMKLGRRFKNDTSAPTKIISVKLDTDTLGALEALKADLGDGYITGKTSIVIRKLILDAFDNRKKR